MLDSHPHNTLYQPFSYPVPRLLSYPLFYPILYILSYTLLYPLSYSIPYPTPPSLSSPLASVKTARTKVIIDPYREAVVSPFKKLITARNTAALWGRRIHHVTMSESVVFALADTGEVYVFGGKNHWWDEIQPDSIYQSTWKGDVTTRSQLLMSIKGAQCVVRSV